MLSMHGIHSFTTVVYNRGVGDQAMLRNLPKEEIQVNIPLPQSQRIIKNQINYYNILLNKSSSKELNYTLKQWF